MLIGSALLAGSPDESISFVLDLTERKQAEAEARESERRYQEMQLELAHANRVATMGQLTSSIAHEVRPAYRRYCYQRLRGTELARPEGA